jgi:hypothetical protein
MVAIKTPSTTKGDATRERLLVIVSEQAIFWQGHIELAQAGQQAGMVHGMVHCYFPRPCIDAQFNPNRWCYL